MSATDNLGPQLLGRKPSTPDARDFKLAHFLNDDPLEVALAGLLRSFTTSRKVKAWAQIVTERLLALVPLPEPTPPPSPEPNPEPTPLDPVVWFNETVLNQSQSGHCVGFSDAGWGNTSPINDHFTDDDGHALYYECKIIDGEPGEENGTSVRSGAKALQNRGRLSAYAFATTVEEIIAWLREHGPIIIGTDWTINMFTPDENGFVYPTGEIAGGHCYLAVGHLPAENAILFLNSWGAEWGAAGYFKMKTYDVASLLAHEGEACAAVELPLPTQV